MQHLAFIREGLGDFAPFLVVLGALAFIYILRIIGVTLGLFSMYKAGKDTFNQLKDIKVKEGGRVTENSMEIDAYCEACGGGMEMVKDEYENVYKGCYNHASCGNREMYQKGGVVYVTKKGKKIRVSSEGSFFDIY